MISKKQGVEGPNRAQIESLNMTSGDIQFLQAMLKEQGLIGDYAPGVMDEETQRALRIYQERNGLRATGFIDKETQDQLGMVTSGPSSKPEWSTWSEPFTGITYDDQGKPKAYQKQGSRFLKVGDSLYRMAEGVAENVTDFFRSDARITPNPFASGNFSTHGTGITQTVQSAAAAAGDVKSVMKAMATSGGVWANPVLYRDPDVIRIMQRELAQAGDIGNVSLDVLDEIMNLPSMANVSSNVLLWEGMNDAEKRIAADSYAAYARNMAGRMGLSLSSGTINGIATQAAIYGWNDAQLEDAIAAHISGGTVHNAGLVQQAYEYARDQGSTYLVNVDDATAMSMARRVASGELDPSSIPAYFKQQAISRYPHLREIIESGVTPGEYFAPYQQQVASILEISPDAVDLVNDERWAKITGITGDDGKTRAMTVSEAMTYAREQDEYKTTRNANEQGAKMVGTLAELFGAAELT